MKWPWVFWMASPSTRPSSHIGPLDGVPQCELRVTEPNGRRYSAQKLIRAVEFKVWQGDGVEPFRDQPYNPPAARLGFHYRRDYQKTMPSEL